MKIRDIVEANMPPDRESGRFLPSWFIYLSQHPYALRYLNLHRYSGEYEISKITLDDIDQAIKQAQMDGNMDWAEHLFRAFDIKYNKDKKAGIFEGVGRITKQNQTQDVGPNQVSIEAAKFGFKVDRDGRPANTAKKAAIAETKNYQNFVKFCCQGLKIKNQPKINFTQEKFDDTFGFFNPETEQLTIRTHGRHPADVMRTLAHELVHHKQKENGEDLDGSDGSPHENQANSLAGVLMRKWANRHPEIFENFADGKKKGKSRPGRVKRSGASCKGSVTSLRKKAKKYKGERGKMYHWCANMKKGRKRKKK